jgi:hypothetical protein
MRVNDDDDQQRYSISTADTAMELIIGTRTTDRRRLPTAPDRPAIAPTRPEASRLTTHSTLLVVNATTRAYP